VAIPVSAGPLALASGALSLSPTSPAAELTPSAALATAPWPRLAPAFALRLADLELVCVLPLDGPCLPVATARRGL